MKRGFNRSAARAPPLQASVLAGYRITGPLRSSAEGVTYLATQRPGLRRPRLIVRRLAATAGGAPREALRDDIAELASLRHGALAMPIWFGSEASSGETIAIRPHVDGADLLSSLAGKSPRDLIPYLAAAAEALAALHCLGLVHGNVKASNLIVPRGATSSRFAPGPRVILCDPALRATELSVASDLHALGVVFHRLLTGEAPRPSDRSLPAPIAELNPEVPLDLERLVRKLLSCGPEGRYRDGAAVLDDLQRLADGKPASRRLPPDCFLGRQEELSRAVAALLEPGGPRTIAVRGEAGVGKSSFLRRLELEAQLLGWETLSVRCHFESATSFSPLRAILESSLASPARDATSRARLERLLARIRAGDESARVPIDRGRFLREATEALFEPRGSQPRLLLVDELHLADSLTIDLLAALVRPSAQGGEGRGAMAVGAAFRPEGPFRAALRPFVEALGGAGVRPLSIDLHGLPADAVQEWLERVLGDAHQARETASRVRPLAGNPCAIRESLRLPDAALPAQRVPRSLEQAYAAYHASLEPPARAVLQVLALLGRPASSQLLDALLDGQAAAGRPLAATLGALREEGTLGEEAGLFALRHDSFRSWLEDALTREERQALHGRIATVLERRAEAQVDEIARHWLASDARPRGSRIALRAGRRLVRSHEDRRALTFFHAAIELLPARAASLRRKAAEEAAEAHARIGELRRAIEIIEGLLAGPRAAGDTARLHGRLGVFLHRAGEIARAVSHLEKALALLRAAPARDRLGERLRLESELAEIASNKGDYAQAEAICRRALDALEGARSAHRGASVARDASNAERREEMVLLETLGHLKLRRFQYAEARALFESSLRAGRRLDLVPEKSLLLNNLGTLHVQQNRLHLAIQAYERAVKLSSRLGDDQSLVTIQSNLAALHAKCGDAEAADEALRRAAAHDERCDSLRARFVRLHNSGLADLHLGRYGTAIEALKEAIALGEELKDGFLVAFDLVYLGECRLFRGEAKPGLVALERAVGRGPSTPGPVPVMVESRRAALLALRGDLRAARQACSRLADLPPAGIAYLDAWNDFFCGWALRLCGLHRDAAARLEACRRFFARIKVPCGEIHASLELAALDLDRRELEAAERRLLGLRQRFRPGQGPLKNPLLAARLLALETQARLERPRPDVAEAAALLVEAESHLIGCRFPDLERLVLDLRRRIRIAVLPAGSSPLVPPAAAADPAALFELARELQEAADDLVARAADRLGEEEAAGLRRHLARFDERVREAQRRLEGTSSGAAAFRADAIVGRSAATRELIHKIRQAAPTRLPILVTGETGTGKELVARAIHGESPRAAGPFVSINCAALPEALLEAELFGYCRGAFSGAEDDRAGLLRSAQGGTFFFDEIGEMPLALQAKLLRVLDRGLIRPVGATEEAAVDVRHVFATHRDLAALVEAGTFRQDLLFRLRGFEIRVPTLRDRLEDLALLVEHFRAQAGGSVQAPGFGDDALRALAAYAWPGNVRELENAVTRLSLTRAQTVRAEDVARVLGNGESGGGFAAAVASGKPLPELQQELEREYVQRLIVDRSGDLPAAARALGITLRALYVRLRRLGIRPREFR